MHTVADYMMAPVVSVRADARLPEIASIFDAQRISAVPVVDDHGAIIGVVSRTDLLRVGARVARARRQGEGLTLPDRPVGEVMSKGTITVAPTTSLPSAAAMMVEHGYHRVFVVDCGKLVGVLSTLDLTAAVRDAEIDEPLSTIMSSPVQVISSHEPLRVALSRLEIDHVSGLVVVEDEWPIGVFTQVEALAANHTSRDAPVEALLDDAMLCLPATTRIRRAAAQAFSMEARRIIATADREIVGIITGTDFARLIAES
jgi:CBS domain-containing protein